MTATFQRYLGQLDRVLAQIEHDRGIVEPSAATARRFTTADNKRWWNDHDWSHRGEEWTPCEAWKAAVRDGFLFPFIPSAESSAPSADRARRHRFDLTDTMILEFAAAGQLDVVLQTSELVNDGDKLTVLRKP